MSNYTTLAEAFRSLAQTAGRSADLKEAGAALLTKNDEMIAAGLMAILPVVDGIAKDLKSISSTVDSLADSIHRQRASRDCQQAIEDIEHEWTKWKAEREPIHGPCPPELEDWWRGKSDRRLAWIYRYHNGIVWPGLAGHQCIPRKEEAAYAIYRRWMRRKPKKPRQPEPKQGPTAHSIQKEIDKINSKLRYNVKIGHEERASLRLELNRLMLDIAKLKE